MINYIIFFGMNKQPPQWNEKNSYMMQFDLILDNDWVVIQDNNWEDIIINSHWWDKEEKGVWNSKED